MVGMFRMRPEPANLKTSVGNFPYHALGEAMGPYMLWPLKEDGVWSGATRAFSMLHTIPGRYCLDHLLIPAPHHSSIRESIPYLKQSENGIYTS